MGQATGVVGFLSMYNDVFEQIRQGGSRRGANMGVCPIWHPDLISFINAKTIEGEIANFNISVAVTDAFMEAVLAKGDWEFTWNGEVQEVEWKGEMVRSVPAVELFDLITTSAHIIGDPGALFIDAANRQNPCPRWYTLESTNPCGEQWLGPYHNCCLGSIAVQAFVSDDGTFDWEAFRKVVVLSAEFLDDVIDANGYVDTVPQLARAAQDHRRIGLGQMGLADALIKLGLRYGSADGLDFASQVTEFMRYHSMVASTNRANERGAFPCIGQSIYDSELLSTLGEGAEFSDTMVDSGTPFTANLWSAPTSLVEHEIEFGRPVLDWALILDLVIRFGIRNSCQGTFAPTGTIATVAGVEGYGCEPVFALSYTRTVMQEGENIVLVYLSGLFEEALIKAGLSEETIDLIKQKVAANDGSCQGVEEVPEEIRRVFVVASDLSPSEHVWMQAVLQAFIDNSISKTVNLIKEATVQDVADAYLLAWQLKAKGITIYRQGSREVEVLATTQAPPTGEVEVIDSAHWPIVRPLPIPVSAESDGLPSRTFTVRTPFGKVRATITTLEEYPDRPFDVELSIGRGGSDVNAFTEAIGRLISVCFRAGVDPDEVIDQLIGIGGRTQEESVRPDKATSLPDAVGKLLRSRVHTLRGLDEAIDATATAIEAEAKRLDPSNLCPECKQATLAYLQGCVQCTNKADNCTYNKCG
jgi:ribonucleoside-diphosphate reductase alpha chain